ncbi:NAD-dependent epimerase/dehydratase family protein [Solimonas sp. K1W22B-7]|uniref:NAD-dependent epimerase/dehydratase family protein n=1 Tax=Solimonas sp. K1W22B-7 TaxID=2303331 RepID=UPI000E3329F8|nr:NAD-dependent epimerase/dehydratase family protein [Solimonas sp. K1W22B-7]AXQ29897.1 NAD-dependent epimerase/dehydratase family protein [Solimonas sp. K1W22B-7]
MNRIAVTGAGGFLGLHLLEALRAAGRDSRVLTRGGSPDARVAALADEVVPGLAPGGDLAAALAGIDTVCHLAGRAHVLQETAADPSIAFHEANVALTERLAIAAAATGVRRFIFISSIGVHGSQGAPGEAWTERSPLHPDTPYGESKRLAEERLRKIAAGSAMQYVILRPTLIHGAGAKGNFERLLRLVQRGLPLPLGSVANRRSFIGARNLCDLILHCVDAPAASNRSYVAADETPLSTAELIRLLGQGSGRPARLWPFPVALLRLAGRLTGRRRMIEQLVGDLVVDASALRAELQWTQPYSTAQSLGEMAAAGRSPANPA